MRETKVEPVSNVDFDISAGVEVLYPDLPWANALNRGQVAGGSLKSAIESIVDAAM